jgi:hypothetical protein
MRLGNFWLTHVKPELRKILSPTRNARVLSWSTARGEVANA